MNGRHIDSRGIRKTDIYMFVHTPHVETVVLIERK
jgi:hypothetical protein